MKVTIELDLDDEGDNFRYLEILGARGAIIVLQDLKSELRSRIKFENHEAAAFAAYQEIYTLLCDRIADQQIPEELIG